VLKLDGILFLVLKKLTSPEHALPVIQYGVASTLTDNISKPLVASLKVSTITEFTHQVPIMVGTTSLKKALVPSISVHGLEKQLTYDSVSEQVSLVLSRMTMKADGAVVTDTLLTISQYGNKTRLSLPTRKFSRRPSTSTTLDQVKNTLLPSAQIC
jgi:hypothetical protein